MVHYSVIKTSDLKVLPIQNICEDNCLLFLWATYPNLPSAMEVMKSWGFKFKTIGFQWVKLNIKNGFPFFGIGYYTASNSEPCLIGIKGKPFKHDKKESSIVMYPRMEHSKKPDEIRRRINTMYPKLSKIELFARKENFIKHIDGWDATGLGYDGKLIQDFLKENIKKVDIIH